MKPSWVLLFVLAAALRAAAEGPDMQTERLRHDVNVAAFGARPDDGRDDTAAFVKALDACRQTPGARLVLAPGRYDFCVGNEMAEPGRGLLVKDCQGLAIIGNGATLVFRGLTRAFELGNCTGLTIENLTVDWDRPPHSTGRVVGVGNGWFDVDVLPEFPVRGGEPIVAFQDYDPVTEFLVAGGLDAWNCVQSTELVRPQVLRVHHGAIGWPMSTNMLLGIRHHVYGYEAFRLLDCTGVRVRDVTVHTCPGMAFIASHCADVALERFRVMRRPGTKWLLSATADGAHFTSCRGPLRIEDCLFEGQGDDALNVHGMFLRVTKVVDARTVEAIEPCYGCWNENADQGDRFDLFHPSVWPPFAQARVKSCTSQEVNSQRVYTLTFDADLSAGLRADDLLRNNDRIGAGLVVRRCTAARNRARGFLVQTQNATIEDNTFDHCSMAALLLCAGLHGGETGGASDVSIRGNRITGVNSAWYGSEAAISVVAFRENGVAAPAGAMRSIRIEGNVIDGTDHAAVCVASADGVVLRGNTIRDANRRPADNLRHPGLGLALAADKAAVYLTESRNVEVDGNIVARPAVAGEPGPVVIGPGCESATIHVKPGKESDHAR